MDKKRYKEIEQALDSSMRVKLNQIRTFLDLRKASVMVGAGFSKNAEMGEDVHMKDWGELCEDFYAALYDSQPSDKDFRLKSALRLAQQIESTMGRTALDEIIKNALPNDSIAPGYLHKLLVSLNWRDIFTTNYDSLLEDAAVKAFRHYNVVTSKDSLIYQPHPRIVKLHGSFPDNRPFIITEEDYRTYPERFPEFVNTIRQALIETQFCLIGFSGDDPNFLSWLGWFRDIMGNQMLPIYMIYVGSRPHDSEVKLLAQRKIEPIITEDISKDPVEAMDFILSYVGSNFKEDEKWSAKLNYSPFDKSNLKDSILKMRKIRESYPGWLLLPADKIETDFNDCHSDFPFMEKAFAELEDTEKLDFLYEYTWRLQTSFMPSWLDKNWYQDAIQETLERYDDIEPKDKKKADYLSVSFLQIQRITGDEDFKKNLQLFRTRISPNNTALHRKLNYEEALWALSHCEFPNLEKILAAWNITPDDYLGALWKSKILVEIDRADEAAKIIEESLGNARRKLMSNSKSDYQLSAVTIMSDCLTYNLHSTNQYKDLDERFRFKKYYDLCKKEIKAEEKSRISHVHDFDIGSHITTWRLGPRGYIQKYVGASRYYLLAEAYGQPLGTNTMTYNSEMNQLAIPLIAESSLDTAVLYLIESRDRQALKDTISRRVILGISEEDATKLYDFWIKVLEPYLMLERKPMKYGRECEIVLPLLARLCVWLNPVRILQLIKLIWIINDLYINDQSEFLVTCYNSLSKDKSVELWWEAMSRPIFLDHRRQEIIKPKVKIEKWNGNTTIVDIIIKGLSSDDLAICEAAVDRFYDIHAILPKDYQGKMDQAILANFDKLLNANLILPFGSYLQLNDNRVWKDRFITYLNKQVIKFTESDFQFSGVSGNLSTFDDFIVTFINCFQYLTQDEINGILRKISNSINDNYKVLHDTNYFNSTFGELKRGLDFIMGHLNTFMIKVDASFIHDALRNELLEKSKSLCDIFPLIRPIVHLSFMGKSIGPIASRKENRQFIKQKLEKDVISSDPKRIQDAFFAVVDSQQLTKGNFPIQEIVKSAIDHIHYCLDTTTNDILLSLPIWIKANLILKQNLRILFSILAELPQRIISSKDITPELKSDMLYYGGYLAGQIARTKFNGIDKSQCVKSWTAFADSHEFPHDIRNGFFKGQEMW